MSPKSYLLLTAILFSIICLLQLSRIAFGWEAIIGGWSVPMWISWLAVVVTAVLAFFGFTYSRNKNVG
jgi:uncharacterized protein YacL